MVTQDANTQRWEVTGHNLRACPVQKHFSPYTSRLPPPPEREDLQGSGLCLFMSCPSSDARWELDHGVGRPVRFRHPDPPPARGSAACRPPRGLTVSPRMAVSPGNALFAPELPPLPLLLQVPEWRDALLEGSSPSGVFEGDHYLPGCPALATSWPVRPTSSSSWCFSPSSRVCVFSFHASLSLSLSPALLC